MTTQAETSHKQELPIEVALTDHGTVAESASDEALDDRTPIFELEGLTVYYGSFRAVRDVDMRIRQNHITALIGPSGCGKSTVLRCFNRMNDLIETARVEGRVDYHGVDLYGEKVDPVEVRRRIGMVFQKPNPFPKSIYENIVYGPRIAGFKGNFADKLTAKLLKRAPGPPFNYRLVMSLTPTAQARSGP